MQRFFLSSQKLDAPQNITEKDRCHQIWKVLRMHEGEKLIFFCGDGYEYIHKISSLKKTKITTQFEKKEKNPLQDKKNIHIFQALPNKFSKLEYLLQKGTETGITSFHLFRADRSQPLMISTKKYERLAKIIQESAEQCGSPTIPALKIEPSLQTNISKENAIALHHSAEQTLPFHEWEKQQTKREVYEIYIGPEGGWSEEEIVFFQNKNIPLLFFPGRVLRTETVASVLGFFLNYQDQKC